MLKVIRFISLLGNAAIFCGASYAFVLEVEGSPDTFSLFAISGFLILSIVNLIVINRQAVMVEKWLYLFHRNQLLKGVETTGRPFPPRDWDKVKKEAIGKPDPDDKTPLYWKILPHFLKAK